MSRRQAVPAVVLAILSVPVLLALVEATSFHTSNRSNGTLVSSGIEREYLLYVPGSYDRAKPTPLVISMHGAGMWPAAQSDASRWNDLADREGFIVVYPSAVRGKGPAAWDVNNGPGLAVDVKFIADLIDMLKSTYNIDGNRIYANGLSNGGGMSFVLSCTMSDRIAAVGLVGSAQTLPWIWCKDKRPVPMVAFHGTRDKFTPYYGGISPVAPMPFPNIETWASNWAKRNQCAPTPVKSTVASDVVRVEYRNCAENAGVVLYTIIGGGHTWPGGGDFPEWLLGRTATSIAATDEMWAFFRDHPLNVTYAQWTTR